MIHFGHGEAVNSSEPLVYRREGTTAATSCIWLTSNERHINQQHGVTQRSQPIHTNIHSQPTQISGLLISASLNSAQFSKPLQKRSERWFEEFSPQNILMPSNAARLHATSHITVYCWRSSQRHCCICYQTADLTDMKCPWISPRRRSHTFFYTVLLTSYITGATANGAMSIYKWISLKYVPQMSNQFWHLKRNFIIF